MSGFGKPRIAAVRNDESELCPECGVLLDPKVHVACAACGRYFPCDDPTPDWTFCERCKSDLCEDCKGRHSCC